MSEPRQKFYLTTPIYYVNARPHIGHAYTTVIADAVARRHRMLGHETILLTGTDEHGQKIERSAAAAGISPQQFATQVSAQFRALWDRMGITYDRFVRTTDADHERGVVKMFKLLKERGYIYKGSYSGQYCVSDELYVDDATPGALCPFCGRETETVEEENYFFKLSAFTEPLLKLYQERPDFIYPETRRNEVIAFVQQGLRDLSISRTTFKWGIPVPDDPAHVIYVWLDALCSYITAIGFGSENEKDKQQFAHFWPANYHMMAKEIVRFHCVYWPAFLLAAGLPLPEKIVAHGWLLFEESKMSKSKGNVVCTETILDVLGADALRYFLCREVVFGQDGSFSFDALVQRYNADLANGLGNLSSRTLAMIQRYFDGEVPYPSATIARTAAEDDLSTLATKTIAEFARLFDGAQYSRALEAAWALLGAVDKYIVETHPWSVASHDDADSRARLATILYAAAEALRIITILAHPILPESTAKIYAQLGLGEIAQVDLNKLAWGQLNVGTRLGPITPVFPRADKSAVERMQQMEEERRNAASATASPAAGPATTVALTTPAAEATAPAIDEAAAFLAPSPTISIDDFAKIELRVGTVLTAEKVEKTDKLIKMTIDIGREVRQIVAGIAKAYEPEKLIGRKVVIVANLAPRKLRGIESQGMVVAASFGEHATPALASFLEDVPNGSRLK